MSYSAVRKLMPELSIRQKQTHNIVMITFWSQFSVYALNTILILFLTRSQFMHGLGYSQTKAYAFIGTSQAMGYLMPLLGGFMADNILGIRRAIFLGSFMLAFAYLLVMLSGFTLTSHGDQLFIAAYALIPVTNSLLMGTASSLISRIYVDDAVQAKASMTFYYMSINVGALLATIVAPSLMDSPYGPLSVLAIAFVGKSIAALNFAYRRTLYENVIWGKDATKLSQKGWYQLIAYIAGIYTLTLIAYSQVYLASIVISIGCGLGLLWFLVKTIRLSGEKRKKQLIALLLIFEAVVFFVIYNQMNSTLVLFAASNSNLNLFGLTVNPAHYQLLNPLLIIILGLQLPKFYRKFPKFIIPYQFACGTLLAGGALMLMAIGSIFAVNGMVNGNFIAITYVMITLAELWVSAIGLSMIGLYCDGRTIAFAMGVWYISQSLSNVISGRLASFVAIPNDMTNAMAKLAIYEGYYWKMGLVTCVVGAVMLIVAVWLKKHFSKGEMVLV